MIQFVGEFCVKCIKKSDKISNSEMLWKVEWNAWSGDLSRKVITVPFHSHLKPVHQGISRWNYASTVSGRWVCILSLKLPEKETSKLLMIIHYRVYQIHLKKKFPLMSNLKHLFCDLSRCFSPSTCSENRNWWLPLVLIKSNYFQNIWNCIHPAS